ncbi:MAG: chromosomal replication initiator protein DnaA [Deltaproteobacteria bacterium]|nr:chromosomal replication initiator protein DnaA [Deltaproteobacteria bacterium]
MLENLTANAIDTWNRAKEILAGRISVHSFCMWIEPMNVIREESKSVVLSCPNPFAERYVLENFKADIEDCLKEAARKPLGIRLEVVEPQRAKTPVERRPAPQPGQQLQPAQICLPGMDVRPWAGHILRFDHTFEQFVVGESNSLAFNAARALASDSSPNLPLFLWSRPGLGKSHLSQAVGRQVLAANPKERVFYITADDFYTEMLQALQNGSRREFRDRYRNGCDTLILEQVQNLSGKDKTQVELSEALDCLMESGKRLIFTSTEKPGSLPGIHETVRSRLCASLVTDIRPPDFATRVRILKKKAEGRRLPEAVLYALAQELTDNVRQLQFGLVSLLTRCSLMNVSADENLARQVASQLASRQRALTMSSIINLVCTHFRMAGSELSGNSRKTQHAVPRQVAMYLARRYTDQSCQAIGKSLNRRHTTVIHAVSAIERHMESRDYVSREVSVLCERIESGDF